MQKLVKRVTQTSLDEKSWKLFIFKSVKNHLQQMQKNVSQIKVIQSLVEIQIPLGEILGYLVIKLNLPLKIHNQQPSKKQRKLSFEEDP